MYADIRSAFAGSIWKFYESSNKKTSTKKQYDENVKFVKKTENMLSNVQWVTPSLHSSQKTMLESLLLNVLLRM